MDRGTGDGYRVQGQVTDGLREALSAGGGVCRLPPVLEAGKQLAELALPSPTGGPVAGLASSPQTPGPRRDPARWRPQKCAESVCVVKLVSSVTPPLW